MRDFISGQEKNDAPTGQADIGKPGILGIYQSKIDQFYREIQTCFSKRDTELYVLFSRGVNTCRLALKLERKQPD